MLKKVEKDMNRRESEMEDDSGFYLVVVYCQCLNTVLGPQSQWLGSGHGQM